MTDLSSPVIIFPGAGGGMADRAIFAVDKDDATCFHTIGYPGWRRYISSGFSAEALIADLAAQVASKVPQGPIHIVGISLGGHFGYAVALCLQALGREVAGFCAIDTYMAGSFTPSIRSRLSALVHGLHFLRKWRIREFARYSRTLFWRSLLKLSRYRLPSLLRIYCASGQLPSVFALDPIFENELSMLLLIRAAAPWLASLDREPISLKVPAILIRTRLLAIDDVAWRRRCPNIEIFEVAGRHLTLFEPENIGSFRAAFIAGTSNWRGSGTQQT
jgi:thioesterase domain-containing protein